MFVRKLHSNMPRGYYAQSQTCLSLRGAHTGTGRSKYTNRIYFSTKCEDVLENGFRDFSIFLTLSLHVILYSIASK